MRVNALKMQILMGKKKLTIKELAYKSAVSRPVSYTHLLPPDFEGSV